MNWLDSLFWMTGMMFWVFVVAVAVLCGLPSGRSFRGVTRICFYEFGPVVWHVLKDNERAFAKAKKCGYRLLHLRGSWYLGMSLPRWLSRRLDSLAGSVA